MAVRLVAFLLLAVAAANAQTITTTGLSSYGHYVVFGQNTGARLEAVDWAYDFRPFSSFVGADVNWTVGVMPAVVLHEAQESTEWGTPLTTTQKSVIGVGVSPIGFRFLWRKDRTVQPFWTARFIMLGFPEKVLARNASYQNFVGESSLGADVLLSKHVAAHVVGFNFLHFSNAGLERSNPGVDFMTSGIGISYAR